LGRNHLHDFTLAKTPTAAKFPAGNGALLYKFIDGSRMDLQQARDLGRGENFFHRHISSRCSPGLTPIYSIGSNAAGKSQIRHQKKKL
jgi:hypothetical protein